MDLSWANWNLMHTIFFYLQQQLAFDYSAAGYHPVFVILQ